MPFARLYMLATYAVFAAAATALAVHGRRRDERAPQPAATGGVRQKLPSYIAMNLAVLAVIWLPRRAWVFPLCLAILGALAEVELVRTLRRIPGRRGRLTLGLAGAAYLPACLIALLNVWQADPTGNRAAFLYLTVAAHDAFAQIVGERAGRRPLAPAVSPAKTVEGALAGLAAAALMGAVLAPAVGWPMAVAGALGLTCGAAALAGDLMASTWKRAAGVKEFGHLLGPHGGVMDRVAGLLLAAVVLALVGG